MLLILQHIECYYCLDAAFGCLFEKGCWGYIAARLVVENLKQGFSENSLRTRPSLRGVGAAFGWK
jgi:hypothetical protein